MERLRQEDLPDLESILHSIYDADGKMLQFTSNEIIVLETFETGETEHRSMRTKDQEYVFNVPVKELRVTRAYHSLALLKEELVVPRRPYDDGVVHEVDYPAFLEWKASLPDTEGFKSAALEIISEDSGDETVVCGNCSGKLVFTHTCSCTEGSLHFYDMTDGTELSDAPEDGMPDPDCTKCHGSGESSNNCPGCNAKGYMIKYPKLRIINEETGENELLTLDVARMLANDEISVTPAGWQNLYETGSIIAEHHWQFNVEDAIARTMGRLGIDPGNSGVVSNGRIYMNSPLINRSDTRRWVMKDNEITISNRYRGSDETPTPKEMLLGAQKSIASGYGRIFMTEDEHAGGTKRMQEIALQRYGRVVNEDGIPIETIRTFRPMRPMEEAFNDLLDSVTSQGLTLGYALSFIATGETGPSFYLMTKEGVPMTQLSNDYGVRYSIENAWIAFQRILERKNHQDTSE